MGYRAKRPSAVCALLGAVIVLMPGMASGQADAALYGPSGVSPMAVRQGNLGSCYFHASLAAVAKADPSAIHNAISGDAERGYRVRFFSGPEELVYPQDIAYAQAHSYDRSEGQWVTVLMRGYAQRALRLSMVEAVQRSTVIPIFVKPVALSALRQTGPLLLAYDRAIRSVIGQDGQIDKINFQAQLNRELGLLGVSAAHAQVLGGLLEEVGFYDAITRTVHENGEVFGAYRSLAQGGIPVNVLQAFLGTAHAASITDDSLTQHLRNLHAGGTAIVAGIKLTIGATTTSSLFDQSFQGGGSDWYVPGHAYTVLDYDDASRTVLLRNPWGTRPAPDGVFRLPLAVFRQAYETFSYSEGATP